MGKQNQYENAEEMEATPGLEAQIKDLADEGYDAEEIEAFLEEQGYTRDEYQSIMENEGLELSDIDDKSDDGVDAGIETTWTDDAYDDSYNDDSYGEGGDW